jgi:hypothetical protein
MNIIPTKNPLALIGYYLGVLALVPFAGLVLAIPSVICSIIGLLAATKNPHLGGAYHAVAGIVLSGLGLFVTVAVGVALYVYMGPMQQPF